MTERRHGNSWTVAQENRLIFLYGSGLKMREIAITVSKEFKTRMTKSAICGKVFRLRKAGKL